MKKLVNSIFKILLVYFFFSNFAEATLKNELIKKIQSTDTLSFEFKQKIENKIEVGNCIIKYPKLIKCDYNDSYKKRIISNGKTLAIIQRKYKKILGLYPIKTTPLNFLLNKEYLIKVVNENEPKIYNDFLIKYEIENENKMISIFFEKDSLNLNGWKTEDIYKKKVEFEISNLKTNIAADNKLFKIPSKDDL